MERIVATRRRKSTRVTRRRSAELANGRGGRAAPTNGWLDPRFLVALVMILVSGVAGYYKNQADTTAKITTVRGACEEKIHALELALKEEAREVAEEEVKDGLGAELPEMKYQMREMYDALGKVADTVNNMERIMIRAHPDID